MAIYLSEMAMWERDGLHRSARRLRFPRPASDPDPKEALAYAHAPPALRTD